LIPDPSNCANHPTAAEAASPSGPPTLPSLPVLMSNLGHVAFRWDAATDALLWGDNVASVIAGCAAEELQTGKTFSRMIEPKPAIRTEAMLQAGKARERSGARYQIEYGLRMRTGAPLLWVEECGYCVFDSAGAPASAHGIIRLINERHARDEILLKLAQRDAMTGELDRTQLLNALTETIAETTRYRGACAFMLIGIDHLSRINDAFGFNVADEVI
jgi:predicted signal transduction protein with EAL and GGDEF domain